MNARSEVQLGVVHGMPIAEYHSLPGVSNSGLTNFSRSPMHYHALHVNPLRPPQAKSRGRLGNLAHCAIFEPAELLDRYAIGPCDDRRLKAWTAWEKDIDRRFTCVQPAEFEAAQAQALSVRSKPQLARLLASGQPEVSAFWADAATGLLCRARPDWVHDLGQRRVILVDGKTYDSACPDDFARQVPRMGYHRQAALYTDGYAAASGDEVVGFVFAVVEDKWPFAACAVMLDEDGIEQGRKENRALLSRFAECRRTDTWPGYSDEIELIQLPRWAMMN